MLPQGGLREEGVLLQRVCRASQRCLTALGEWNRRRCFGTIGVTNGHGEVETRNQRDHECCQSTEAGLPVEEV